MAHQSTGRLVRVIASAAYGFLSWEATVEHLADGSAAFICRPSLKAIQWEHLLNLQDWLVVGTAPALLKDSRGPVCWLQQGEPTTLPCALCLRGLPLNKEQLLQLILLLGGVAPAGANKRQLQEYLIDNLLPQEDKAKGLQELDRVHGAKNFEDEIDSELSEVLSELGKEDGNAQDLKDYKQKRQVQRMKRKLQSADMEIQQGKKSSGKGRGRGKGKGKRKKQTTTQEKTQDVGQEAKEAGHCA